MIPTFCSSECWLLWILIIYLLGIIMMMNYVLCYVLYININCGLNDIAWYYYSTEYHYKGFLIRHSNLNPGSFVPEIATKTCYKNLDVRLANKSLSHWNILWLMLFRRPMWHCQKPMESLINNKLVGTQDPYILNVEICTPAWFQVNTNLLHKVRKLRQNWNCCKLPFFLKYTLILQISIYPKFAKFT